MAARRAPEDGPPRSVPSPYPEENDAIRWELPVTVDHVKGLLVIRVHAWKDDPEVSVRGHAVEWLRRSEREQGGKEP